MTSEGVLPSFDGATGWLKSPPLSTADLRGKVVLVDFWTYTCINWLRTLAYVRAWAERYEDDGLLVVGVHTPEFPFEHDVENVREAVRAMNVHWPVALDNDYAIWDAFANRYWPAVYIAGADGRIRHHHFGEGGFEECERVIQGLLRDNGRDGVDDGLATVAGDGLEAQADWANLETPETYLGSSQGESGSPPTTAARTATSCRMGLKLNHWALDGEWTIGSRAAVLNQAGGTDRVPLPRARRASRHGAA